MSDATLPLVPLSPSCLLEMLIGAPSAVEFATVGKTKDGRIYHHLWGADEINALLKQHGLAKEEETETG